jgi:hypothetical protein
VRRLGEGIGGSLIQGYYLEELSHEEGLRLVPSEPGQSYLVLKGNEIGVLCQSLSAKADLSGLQARREAT